MKHLYWKDILHYTRPDTHPDVQEWQRIIAQQEREYGKSLYSIKITHVLDKTNQ